MKTKGFSIVLIIVILAFLVAGLFVLTKVPQPGSESPLTPTSQPGRKLVALGASFTKANNPASNLTGDHPEYSFVTGTKINSLYLFLKGKEKSLTAINLAESGVDSSTVLQKQVPNAVSYHPKYVTLDITTDIFQNETPDLLKRNFDQIISQLKGGDTVILLGSYPNLPLLRTAPHQSCKEDKLQVGFDKVTSQKIQAFNQALQELASKYNLVFVDIYNVLGPSDVSDYDCIHPNIEGQKKLAQARIKALEKGR